jgi:hypothetical protein
MVKKYNYTLYASQIKCFVNLQKYKLQKVIAVHFTNWITRKS